jgi:acetyl esterase/lipase
MFHRLLSLCLLCGSLEAIAATWLSPATGRSLELVLLEPTADRADARQPVPVVFYLENLAAPRVGTESDDNIIRDLRAAGHLVVLLDYAHDPRARVPALNGDLAALRRQLQQKTLLAGRALDRAHIFIVPAGCRLKRDVVYYRDEKRTLAMDIIYPSQPAQPTGAVLEFSCDNANRMGNFSLDFCTDTLLPAAAIAGHAAAMADHPVAAPYRGIDAMPDCARKIKAAVRTLRAEGATLGLNGRIVAAGFSRGSGMALMLATTAGHHEFDGFGENPGTDSRVQGAIVMSGRFTYLDLLADDKAVRHYNQVWGPRAEHPDVWRNHGALDYLTQPPGFPLFLTINISEGPDALHQMEVLRRRLTELGSAFTYEPEMEPRGHHMPLAPAVLDPLYRYLQGQLQVASTQPPASQPAP